MEGVNYRGLSGRNNGGGERRSIPYFRLTDLLVQHPHVPPREEIGHELSSADRRERYPGSFIFKDVEA